MTRLFGVFTHLFFRCILGRPRGIAGISGQPQGIARVGQPQGIALTMLLLVLAGSGVFGQVSLPRIFSDHMVLQRDQPIPVWGWAAPKEKVTVMWKDESYTVKAGRDGSWRVDLPKGPAGGPFELSVAGKKQKILFRDVLVGEVWICSGQSNMEWRLSNVNNAEAEVAAAKYPMIRLITLPHVTEPSPVKDFPRGEWQVCTPQTAEPFSAVGYFFGRKLFQELNVPIGLINTNWGGTEVETWISEDSIRQIPVFAKELEATRQMDFEKMNADRKARLEAALNQAGPVENIPKGSMAKWEGPDLDAGKWGKMTLPKLWEQAGLEGLNGVVWFRFELDLPADAAGQTATLSLGPIDDSDITWLNGREVGRTDNKYNEPRLYKISAGVLKAGRNVIAVRVEDYQGGGGLYGDPKAMYLETGGKSYPLAGEWRYRISPVDFQVETAAMNPNNRVSLLFNSMINPLIPYALQGAIWYQGESNAGRAYQYRRIFPMMIRDWRSRWGREMPFYWVQLANFMSPKDPPAASEWAELREAQSMTLSLPNTGQALAIDIGEAADIHPRNKQDVGLRLALLALNRTYGKKAVADSGPTLQNVEFKGREVVLTFDHAEGMHAKGRYGYPKGFTIAGEDQVFHWAPARIDGNRIIVWHPDIASPKAVRYAWADNPDDANVYNEAGLPMGAFRTDVWRGVTAGRE
ncbi:MAG: sialate O-acetylesterase [Saprospiraceae bacterium]|nr:sialate O-acetylesterase [Saprospiraceae bacterium]